MGLQQITILDYNYKKVCTPHNTTQIHGSRFPSITIANGRILTEIHFVLINQDKKVIIIPVGIGRGVKDSELKTLAGENGHYLHPVNFAHLPNILGKLKDAACGRVLISLYILVISISL